ncbi:helix-turn-helix domain-containing protein [Paenibacillus koleovorans]|uniref:helix-turn-helix domain-containing protein n=1 Tax=Paenibacillus koleovorans TaxID=121608 RepID=UPI000FDAAD56|nr:helix-turn-helix domain-containing protein [Paenibacillus koleovorans]
MRRNWFYRMLFSYMPVFLAVCLTLLFILFLTVRQLSERSSLQSGETVAQNAARNLDQSLLDIENGMFQLIQSDARIAGYYNGPDDFFQASAYQAATALTGLQTRFPLIHSLYLVKPGERKVLEATSIVELDRYKDLAYIEAKRKEEKRFVWGDRRTIAAPGASESETIDVISLARLSDLRTSGLLVVQVSTASLQRMLGQTVNPSSGYLRVVDAQGIEISSTLLPGMYGKETKKLAAVPMSYTEWTIESGVLQPGLLSWAEPVLYLAISIGGGCILLGLVWMVFATRRHYRPVQRLVQQIGSLALKKSGGDDAPTGDDAPAGGKRDEFHAIGKALDQLWSHSHQLEQENERNLKFKREHHFRRLAEGRFERSSFYGVLEEELFELRLDSGRPTAVLVELDQYEARWVGGYSDADLQAMKERLQAEWDRCMLDHGLSASSEWLSDSWLGAIVIQQDGRDGEEQLMLVMEQARRRLAGELPLTVTIAVGTAVERIEAISVSFQTARQALSYKVSLGLNRIITERDLPVIEQPNTVRELQRIEEISRSLRLGEIWEDDLGRLFAALQAGSFNGEQVRSLLSVLLFHIQHKMADLPQELEPVWLSESVRLEQALNQGETLTDIGERLCESLQVVSERIRGWRESKSNRAILQDVKKFIDEHFANPNLSQALLADAFRLHPSSISRLFKEEYGIKFVDYVNGVRVEQASRLMKETGATVQDVAERVGFMQSKTFISAFKKVTGYTPGNYQKGRTGTEE